MSGGAVSGGRVRLGMDMNWYCGHSQLLSEELPLRDSAPPFLHSLVARLSQAFSIVGATGPADRNVLTSKWQWRSLTTRIILKNRRNNSVCRRHCLLRARSQLTP